MKIDENIRESLKIANNTSTIPDGNFKKLLENTFSVLMGREEPHNMASLYNSKADLVKQFYAALLSATAQFVRHNLDTSAVTKFLTDISYNPAKIALFCEFYQKNLAEIQMALLNINTHVPHVTDVTWKIDYIVKASNMHNNDGPLFRIGLQTEKNENGNKIVDFVRFNCTGQELQDLVYKLKDAVRHCQRIGNGLMQS